mmetsp:Transcript_2959/g.8342  ORF Transcript_2959/g.8342 Transcript_2959/m.8342 type:complete len:143 (+) Transcript_2959:338-766(+)
MPPSELAPAATGVRADAHGPPLPHDRKGDGSEDSEEGPPLRRLFVLRGLRMRTPSGEGVSGESWRLASSPGLSGVQPASSCQQGATRTSRRWRRDGYTLRLSPCGGVLLTARELIMAGNWQLRPRAPATGWASPSRHRATGE